MMVRVPGAGVPRFRGSTGPGVPGCWFSVDATWATRSRTRTSAPRNPPNLGISASRHPEPRTRTSNRRITVMSLFTSTKTTLPTGEAALKGREASMPVADRHAVNGTPMQAPFPAGLEQAVFGLGCFWGAERKFYQTAGVYSTAVGYAGGYTKNPSYEEVCSGRTGHA